LQFAKRFALLQLGMLGDLCDIFVKTYRGRKPARASSYRFRVQTWNHETMDPFLLALLSLFLSFFFRPVSSIQRMFESYKQRRKEKHREESAAKGIDLAL